MIGELQARPIGGLPEIQGGDELGGLIVAALNEELKPGDLIVVSQKAVSKAEGRSVALGSVTPGSRAQELAAQLEKDPRLVELILSESQEVVRAERSVLVVRTTSGLVCANAGIDSSNVPGDEVVVLLPEDPDASARRIRAELHAAAGIAPGVIIADSFGRPWRVGQVEVAIGCAGVRPLDNWRGRKDHDGRELKATEIAVADQAAAAADLVRSKDAGVPAVLLRGLERFVTHEDGPGAAALRRAREDDLFGVLG